MVFGILPVLQCLVPLEMYKGEHIDLKHHHCLHVTSASAQQCIIEKNH